MMNIDFFRDRLNLSIKELADKIGVEEKEMEEYESGVKEPSDEILQKLSKEFEVSVRYIKFKNLELYTMEPSEILSLNIRKLREKHNITQQELADKMGISLEYLQGCEKGGLLSTYISSEISRIFNISEELLTNELVDEDFCQSDIYLSLHARLYVMDRLMKEGMDLDTALYKVHITRSMYEYCKWDRNEEMKKYEKEFEKLREGRTTYVKVTRNNDNKYLS